MACKQFDRAADAINRTEDICDRVKNKKGGDCSFKAGRLFTGSCFWRAPVPETPPRHDSPKFQFPISNPDRWIFSLFAHGQFRVGQGLQTPLRPRPRVLCQAETHAQGFRRLVSRRHRDPRCQSLSPLRHYYLQQFPISNDIPGNCTHNSMLLVNIVRRRTRIRTEWPSSTPPGKNNSRSLPRAGQVSSYSSARLNKTRRNRRNLRTGGCATTTVDTLRGSGSGASNAVQKGNVRRNYYHGLTAIYFL